MGLHLAQWHAPSLHSLTIHIDSFKQETKETSYSKPSLCIVSFYSSLAGNQDEKVQVQE